MAIPPVGHDGASGTAVTGASPHLRASDSVTLILLDGPYADMADADTDADAEDDPDDAGDDPAGPEAVDDLVARAAAFDEEIAVEVSSLKERVSELEEELSDKAETIDELEDRVRRERADFQNYKKRAKKREEELRERATEDLVERLLDVRDNLVRALSQEDDVEVRDGVEATLATFDRVLDAENVAAIEPEPGEEVDPTRHEVVMRVDGDRPAGTVEDVYRPGYEMAGRVLRPAQITVSEEPADTDATEESDEPAGAEEADGPGQSEE